MRFSAAKPGTMPAANAASTPKNGGIMRMETVEFSAPVFEDHPPGWQRPTDIVEGFNLAWALELKERMRVSPFAPFAEGVRDLLPDAYKFDTLGRLMHLWPGATGSDFGESPLIRLTTLCGTWQLFDLMNQAWRIAPFDYARYAEVLAFVTGGSERPSLYKDLSANLSKCLLAVRLRREFTQQDELDLSEEWFLTGDQEHTFKDSRGNDSLLFHFNNFQSIPLGLFEHEFVETVWATARVTVDRLGPDRVIMLHKDRLDSLLDLLERGAQKAKTAQHQMSPRQFRFLFDFWPGWA